MVNRVSNPVMEKQQLCFVGVGGNGLFDLFYSEVQELLLCIENLA